MTEKLPDRFESIEALEEFMTRPSQALIDDLARTPARLLEGRDRGGGIRGELALLGPEGARSAESEAESRDHAPEARATGTGGGSRRGHQCVRAYNTMSIVTA